MHCTEIYLVRFENTIAYVIEELDERDREEFYRLKKIQDKKKIIRAKQKKLADELTAKEAAKALTPAVDQPARSILEQQHDPDIIGGACLGVNGVPPPPWGVMGSKLLLHCQANALTTVLALPLFERSENRVRPML
eukprot:sb/3474598/